MNSTTLTSKPAANSGSWIVKLTPGAVLAGSVACAGALTLAAFWPALTNHDGELRPDSSVEIARRSMTSQEFMEKYCSESESSDTCVSVAQSVNEQKLAAKPATAATRPVALSR